MKIIALFAMLFAVIEPAIGATPEANAKPDIRISVKAVTAGSDFNKKSKTSSRRLQIHLENREHRELTDLQLEWKIISEGLDSKGKKVEKSGTQTIKLGADEALDVESGVAQFTEKEGGTKSVGKGKNRRSVPQPDTGRNYAGYLVELKQNGKLIAEAATIGIRKQIGQ